MPPSEIGVGDFSFLLMQAAIFLFAFACPPQTRVPVDVSVGDSSSLASRFSPNCLLDFLASASEVTVPCLKVCRFVSSIMENYKMGKKKGRLPSFVLRFGYRRERS